MKKKIIKLINNERTNKKIISAKGCDTTSFDECATQNYDNAHCTIYSYDQCVKGDYAACTNSSIDYCSYDHAGCYQNQSQDTCEIDWNA